MSNLLINPNPLMIVEPETCKRYRAMLDELPDYFEQGRLDEIVNDLQLIYYSQALAEFGTTVLDKNANLNTDKRGRIENLLRKAETQKKGSKIGRAFAQETAPGYRVKARKANPDGDNCLWYDLGLELGQIKNCWIKFEKPDREYIEGIMHKENVKIALQWLQADIDIGACVYLINEEPDGERFRPKVQTRLYISRTKNNEEVFFLDTIENGYISASEISEWTDKNRGKELLYCIAGAVEAARRYGIKKIVLGEREAQQLGVSLGFKEEYIFSEESNLKIGYPSNGSGQSGPYEYTLSRSQRWRVLNTDDIIPVDGENVNLQLDQLEAFLAGYKKIRKNANKKQEVGLYLQCLEAINETSHPTNYEDNSQRIAQIREKYEIACEKPPEPADQPKAAPPTEAQPGFYRTPVTSYDYTNTFFYHPDPHDPGMIYNSLPELLINEPTEKKIEESYEYQPGLDLKTLESIVSDHETFEMLYKEYMLLFKK